MTTPKSLMDTVYAYGAKARQEGDWTTAGVTAVAEDLVDALGKGVSASVWVPRVRQAFDSNLALAQAGGDLVEVEAWLAMIGLLDTVVV